MDLGLRGRVATVAAARKGLGRAVAEKLAREGASLAICARTASKLERAAAHISESTGGEVFHEAADVTNPASVSHLVAAVEERFGRLDICVASSGGPPSKLFRDTNPEDWRSAVEVLLISAVFFKREALPLMQENKWVVFANGTRQIPAARIRTRQAFAAVVTFLASERASYVNGASIAVDGGMVRSLL